MTKGRVIAGIIVFAVLAVIAGGWYLGTASAATSISAATATRARLDVDVTASGTLGAATPRAVYPPAEGTLASIAVTDGQQVDKGQELGRLDTTHLSLAVAQAEAELAAARALPTGTTRLRTARTSAITAAQAALDLARRNLGRATLKAPVAGTVQFTSLSLIPGGGPLYRTQAGATVSPGLPVFTVVTPGDLAFTAQVDESDIAGVERGLSASVTLDAHPTTPLSGEVTAVQPQAVQTSTGGTAFGVTIRLDAGDARLLSGMTGDATIAVDQVEDALVVPAQAVLTEDGRTWVFTVADGRATRTPVTVGASSDTQVQVTDGLAEGAVVATSQLSALTDGAKVDVRD